MQPPLTHAHKRPNPNAKISSYTASLGDLSVFEADPRLIDTTQHARLPPMQAPLLIIILKVSK